MTPAQAAARLGVALSTVEREIKAGHLPAFRVRGRIVVREDDLNDYINRCTIVPAAETAAVAAGAGAEDDQWRPE